jgi:hypothetical protein
VFSKNRKNGFFLAWLILFSILVQSIHSTEHLAEEISRTHCDHEYDNSHNTINHAHDGSATCFTCEFTFSIATTSSQCSFVQGQPLNQTEQLRFFYTSPLKTFTGSLFSHRGPPHFIV